MRVLELISPTGYYGAERVLVTLAKYLQKAGVDVSTGIFSATHGAAHEVAERAGEAGVAVFEVPCAGRVDLGAVRTLRRRIREMRASVVHTHGYKTDLYARLACWGLGIPLVATYHHGTAEPNQEWTLKLYDKLDYQVLRTFDRVVAVSDPIRAFLAQAGVPQRKVSVILNGIDLGDFPENAEATLRRDLSLGNARTVGMVGRLHPEKGPQQLLAAAQKVLNQLPDVIFVIVGDGPQRRELDDLVRTLGIDKSVRFPGFRTDMAGVYRSLDVVVLPSLNEGLPMTLIEAMAMKRPVVATDVGGVPAVVRHNETGILLKSADPQGLAQAIVELLQDPARAARLAGSGQDLVKARYSADRMTREYLDLFRGVCGAC